MTATQKKRSTQKPAKGPRSGACPMVGLRLERDRIKAIDRKADELGGVSRSAIIKIALKRYGL